MDLATNINKLLDKMQKVGYIDIKFKNKTACNGFIEPRIYGLVKVHKSLLITIILYYIL